MSGTPGLDTHFYDDDHALSKKIKVERRAALKGDIEFRVFPVRPAGDLGIPHDSPMGAAIGSATVSAARVKEMVEGYFTDVVNTYLESSDAAALVDMHAERAMERAIQEAIENGWNDGRERRTVGSVISKKIQEMASARLASEYEVDVSVTLRRKS